MDVAKSGNTALAPLVGFLNLPTVRQLGLMFGLAASVALGFAVVLWTQQPDYGILYTGLGQQDAALVVDRLQQKGIKYKLDSTTGAIMVPSRNVPEVRLMLADAGLPRSSGVGFDILEKEQQFGTSQFMEKARFNRALEGELAKSITSIGAVKSARVHLALPKQSVFVRKRQQPSASVLVNLYAGRNLEAEQVNAITHLVASSIPNLEPGRVTVVDQRGRLLSDRPETPGMAATQEQLQYTHQLEDSYASRIENILAPIVGVDGVRAQVSADLDFSISEQTQETYNPDLPAPRSEQVYEQETRDKGAEGVPGALSNQPPGEATVPEQATGKDGKAGSSKPLKTVRRSTVNYELDRTISHTKKPTGQVQRLSVAVVVDDKVVTDDKGKVTHAKRTPEELARITSLVKDAIGYDARRGDTVNVINASFTDTNTVEAVPTAPLWKQAWAWDLAGKIGAGLLVLLLTLGLIRVMRNLAAFKGAGAGGGGELAVAGAGGGVAGGVADDQLTLSGGSGTDSVLLPGPDKAYEENLNQARQMAMQDPKRVAQVVRNWVHAEE